MTYCTDFVCTYLEHDKEDQEDIYRAQFLQAFSLNEWDGKVIADTTTSVYNEIKDTEIIKNLLREMKNMRENTSPLMQFFMITHDNDLEETLIRILFSFHFFNLIHKIICELRNNTNYMNNDIIQEITNKMKGL